jgi:hypothetical protein
LQQPLVHHKPHLVAKQFGLDATQLVDSIDFLEYPIKTKANVGPFAHNYFKDYETETAHWNRCACIFNIQLPELNLRSKLIGIPSGSGDVSNTRVEGSSTLRRLVITTPSVPSSNHHISEPTSSTGPSRLRISPRESPVPQQCESIVLENSEITARRISTNIRERVARYSQGETG